MLKKKKSLLFIFSPINVARKSVLNNQLKNVQLKTIVNR